MIYDRDCVWPTETKLLPSGPLQGNFAHSLYKLKLDRKTFVKSIMWLATVSYYFSVYSKVSFWCNIYFLFSRKSLISICFWCGVYKPLLASVLCINIDTIYEPHVYICFLFNIEMKWWSKSILSTKLPLPSAFFLSQRTDGERWCFKLLSAVVCSAASMAGLWVLARKLSLHAGTTESALTPPILQVACQWLTGSVPLHSHCPLTACRPQDTLGSKPFLLVASHRLVPTAAVFLIPPFCVDLRSRLPAQQNRVWAPRHLEPTIRRVSCSLFPFM